MADVYSNALALERCAISHAVSRLRRELEHGYSPQAVKSVSAFVGQLMSSVGSMRRASQSMPSAMSEATHQVSEEAVLAVLEHARQFREEAMRTPLEEPRADVLEQFLASLSSLE